MTPAKPPARARLEFDDALLRRLERLSLRAQRITAAAGGRPGTLRVPAADFIDHRPYSPGDDQRHIDWPAAARHDALFVKVGRAPQSASVHLLLDVSPSMATVARKWGLARELGAALGWMSLAHGDRVTVNTFPLEPSRWAWGPARGSGQGPGLLAHLAAISPAAVATTTLGPAVRRVVFGWPAGGLIAVVSDMWLVDDLEAALSLAPPPRWEVLILQILAREELTPTLGGEFELVDAESGQALMLLVDRAIRASYRAALNARFERLRRVAARHGASYSLLPADWPLERAVIPYLQRRMVLAP